MYKGGEETQSLTDTWEGSMQDECNAADEKYGEDSDESYNAHKNIEFKYIIAHVEFVASVLKEQS